MALIVISKDDVQDVTSNLRTNSIKFMDFGDMYNVQHRFCSKLEQDDWSEEPTDKFLQHPDVKAYLDSLGIRYDSTVQRVYSDNWESRFQTTGRFVTHLNYYVQASCLMLSESNITSFFVEDYMVLDPKYSAFALKRKDVYFVSDDFPSLSVCLHDFVENGVDVVYYGKKFTASEKSSDVLGELYDVEYDNRHLSKELDSMVFANYLASSSVVYPYCISLQRFTNSDEECFKDVDILIKGEFNFDETYRRYPVHKLFHVSNNWYYVDTNTYKYPDTAGVIHEAFFETEVYCFDSEGCNDMSPATEVFALVLDCDENCDARHYWEHVSFIGKYNKQSKLITILDKHEGLLEFHELLQNSVDLADTAEFKMTRRNRL